MRFLLGICLPLAVHFLWLLRFRDEELLFRTIRDRHIGMRLWPGLDSGMWLPRDITEPLFAVSAYVFSPLLLPAASPGFLPNRDDLRGGWSICLLVSQIVMMLPLKSLFPVTWSHCFPDCRESSQGDKGTIMLHLGNLASPILPTSSHPCSRVMVSIASALGYRRLHIKSPVSNLCCNKPSWWFWNMQSLRVTGLGN